jgi:hypothetical protein
MTRTTNTRALANANLRRHAATAGAAAAGGPTAALGAGHGLAGVIATALVSVIACTVAAFGRDLVRLCTPPSVRSMRWVVKNGHLEGKFSPEQLIRLTQTLHQQEQNVQQPPAETPAPNAGAAPDPRRDGPEG